jgi:hypothetical protein
MIGGEDDVVARLDPIFKTIAPGPTAPNRRPVAPEGRDRPTGLPALRTQRRRTLRQDGAQRHRIRDDGGDRRGPQHLKHANVGNVAVEADAETTPLRDPEFYKFDFDLPEVAEVWRHGSVVSSWLVDLTADASRARPDSTSSADASRTPARAVGPSKPPLTSRCPPGDQRGAVAAIRVAQSGRVHRQGALGDARRVRWTRREEIVACTTSCANSPTPRPSRPRRPSTWRVFTTTQSRRTVDSRSP